MERVAIIGTTSWGTTLGVMLARRAIPVRLWARSAEEASALNAAQENAKLLPGIHFPPHLIVTPVLQEALDNAWLVILAVPSQSMRWNLRQTIPSLDSSSVLLSASKGLEMETRKRMSQVMLEELPSRFHPNVCVLSGPNLALEVARGLLSTTVVASPDAKVAERVQQLMMGPNFRVYTNTDVIGVELGGALKNIIALGAGMGDGLGYGDNAKAAFMTRGLAEITRLGVAMGANPLTFSGLAGLGDLIATCASRYSRNRYVGEEMAKGRSLESIRSSMSHVAEGVPTAAAAYAIAQEMGVDMPITQGMYRVLFQGHDVLQAVEELMGRPPKAELTGISEPSPNKPIY